MKRILFLALLLAFLHPLSAQHTSLSVSTQLHTPFWLFLDEVLQNDYATLSLEIPAIPLGNHELRVVLDDPARHTFGQQMIFTSFPKVLVINRQGPYFGWEEKGHHPTDIPMADAMDFEEAKAALIAESYDNTRLTLAKQIVAHNPMTASQVTEICKLFSFESNRLEFAKYAYPYCKDKNKYYLVNIAFSYDATKRELDAFLKGQ